MDTTTVLSVLAGPRVDMVHLERIGILPQLHPAFPVASHGAQQKEASCKPKRQFKPPPPAVKLQVEEKISGLVDADANFLHEDLRDDVEAHLTAAKLAGVAHFVTPVVCLQDCQPGGQLAQDHPGEIFVTAGVHPFWSAATVGGEVRDGGVDFSDAAFETLRGYARQDVFRGVGECGLDLVRGPSEPNGFPALEAQLPWFEAQVRLACELQKPLFLHVREAFEPFMAVIARHRGELPPALMHAFTGTEAELEAYRQLDFHIGVTGFICRKSVALREFLPRHVPLERLVVETDAPYMGFRGCRSGEAERRKDSYPNVPAALPRVVEAVAECYGVTPQKVAAVTTATAKAFFNM